MKLWNTKRLVKRTQDEIRTVVNAVPGVKTLQMIR